VFKRLRDTNLPEVPFSLSNAYILLLDDLLEGLISDAEDKLIRLCIEQYTHNGSDHSTYKSLFFSFLVDLLPNH